MVRRSLYKSPNRVSLSLTHRSLHFQTSKLYNETSTMAMAFKMVKTKLISLTLSLTINLLIFTSFWFHFFNAESQATTGMWVSDECKNSFMEMKWKKVHRYIVFKIDEGSRLVTVDKVGGPAESYDDLTASLPNDDCRYAVFDFDFVTVDNCRKSKIFFIAWYIHRFCSVFPRSRIWIWLFC